MRQRRVDNPKKARDVVRVGASADNVDGTTADSANATESLSTLPLDLGEQSAPQKEEEDDSTESLSTTTSFAGEVFHMLQRDRALEAQIESHGGSLAAHTHSGVTRCVGSDDAIEKFVRGAKSSDEQRRRRLLCVTAGQVAAALAGATPLPVIGAVEKSKPEDDDDDDNAADALTSHKRTRDVTPPSTASTSSTKKAKTSPSTPSSSPPPAVIDFVNWLADVDDMRRALAFYDMDTSKMGQLSHSQLRKGYDVLHSIEVVLKAKCECVFLFPVFFAQ